MWKDINGLHEKVKTLSIDDVKNRLGANHMVLFSSPFQFARPLVRSMIFFKVESCSMYRGDSA